MLFALIRDSDGKDVGLIPLAEKAFTSGSRGYFGQAKLDVNGVKHQAQVQLVAIGSKPVAGDSDAR
jgi:hypothetical protein